MADNLTGSFHVRALRPAFDDADHLFRRSRDRAELRRHALKLRFWPESTVAGPSGELVDLDWSWVRALEGLKVGELRIRDMIGAHDNLRIIFHIGPPTEEASRRIAWVLAVMQKRRDDFSRHDLAIFRARRLMVRTRFYDELV